MSTALRIAAPSSGMLADHVSPLIVAGTPLTTTLESESPSVSS